MRKARKSKFIQTPYNIRLEEALGDRDSAWLAERIGISESGVNMALTGQTKAFSAERSAKAARVLGVNHYWLATGIGSREGTDLHDLADALDAVEDPQDRAERLFIVRQVASGRYGPALRALSEKLEGQPARYPESQHVEPT